MQVKVKEDRRGVNVVLTLGEVRNLEVSSW